jgi:hypothetical protein
VKSRKNYFEEIKNHRVEDKFIEHLIRLLFFTVIIGIESIYQRIKEFLFHIKNFFLNRRMSDVLGKYAKYKESVHSLMKKTVHNKKLPMQIHETINNHFSEYEKRIIFGLRESRDNIISSSRKLLISVKGYTRRMRLRYFEYIPDISLTRRVSFALISVQFLRRSGRKQGIKNSSPDMAETVKYLHSISDAYKKYMTSKFEKFYTEEFRQKISHSSAKMKTVRTNIKKLTDTVKKAEQRQSRYRFSSTSH